MTRGVVPATAVGAALAPAGIDMPRGEANVVSLRSARAALVAAVRDIIMVRCIGPAGFAGAGAAAVGVPRPTTV